jgi:GDP-mannose 6-dehydrogenase
VIRKTQSLRLVPNADIQTAAKPSISVIGLGYVGAVSMACLARLGHRMIGVDISPSRVDAIRAGRSPIMEAQLGELLAEGVADGKITATADLFNAVLDTDITFLSVGTPTSEDGSCDLSYVRAASQTIGQALAHKSGFHTIVLRCSVPPGTTLGVVAAEIEAASNKKLTRDFGVAFNPEFLREGVAVDDFYDPPKTVVGASDPRTEVEVARVFTAIDAKIIFTSIEAAEMVKYVDNVWHASKVVFGNEIGRLCKGLGIDSHRVMDIFCQDKKLNLSPYYLKPGHAFGGSCLPKEVRAVTHLAESRGLDLPLINSVLKSNRSHLTHALRLLERFQGKRIGFLGLTFKPGTDDLRESPTLDLMSMLASQGYSLSAFDPNIGLGAGAKSRVDAAIAARPAIRDFLKTLPDLMSRNASTLVNSVDVVVVAHATDEYRRAVANRKPHIFVLDLARLVDKLPEDRTYEGIAW